MPDDSAINQWGKIWTEAERRTGVIFDIVDSGCMENGIKEAGFTNVQVEDFLVSFLYICAAVRLRFNEKGVVMTNFQPIGSRLLLAHG